MNKEIQLVDITKRFPGVTACDHISLTFKAGEIHALLGENGAGKTTLMNMLYGILKADEGRILIDGAITHINSTHDAIANGIGMVHQHFMLVQKFTVLENIILGSKLDREPFLDYEAARKRIEDLMQETGLHVPLDRKVGDLSVGDQQRVEIIKALYKGAKTLIMDEPTSVLTPLEVDELFCMIRTWTERGNTVILITHKMREVIEICDRISVLRDGKKIDTISARDVDCDQVAEMMVGRCIITNLEKEDLSEQEVILSVEHMKARNTQGILAVDDVSFQVRRGEIVGIAGVDGNGQLELIEAIMGLVRTEGGTVSLEGENITNMTPGRILEKGISNIPFRRQKEGLALNFSILDNFILKEHWKKPYAKRGILQKKAIYHKAQEAIEQYNIKAIGPQTKAANMSGGNQQKIVVAREIAREHDLLIACHPTHGLDIGAIEFIHKKLLEERTNNKGVLLVSTELDELFCLSDRLLVMYQGKIMGEVDAKSIDLREIGLMMLGNRGSEKGSACHGRKQ